jgi:hypothetical protein
MALIKLVFACLLINGVLAAQDRLERNTDYHGTNINNGLEQKTDNAEDCQTLCEIALGCEGFTWASYNFPGFFLPLFGLQLLYA